MADLNLVVGATAPSVFGTLVTAEGSAINLTDATVRFQMRLTMDRRFAVDAVATVVDAATGRVRYDWLPGDLAAPGSYVSRWRIQYQDGAVEYTEPENTIAVDAQ